MKLLIGLIGFTFCLSIWQIMLQQQQAEQFYESTSIFNDSTLPSPPSSTVIIDLQPELLPKNDYSQLIDLEDFEFLIAPRTCRDLSRPPIVIVLVHSAPENFQKRVVIRETWGSRRNDTRAHLLFLIGAVNSTKLQDKIELESKAHGDVMQGSFQDSYRNMTYKHVMALKWFVYNCHDAQYLLKTDDDVFVNLPLLNSYLELPAQPSLHIPSSNLMFCHRISRAKVKRTYRSKWRVAYDEFTERYYPDHCPGFVILYSADVVAQLYKEAQKQAYFWIDDVHVTGNVASKLNIPIFPLGDVYLNEEKQQDLLAGKVYVEDVPFLFAQPDLKEVQIRKLWKLVMGTRERTTLLNENDVE